MKKLLLFATVIALSMNVMAQGNSGKAKGKNKTVKTTGVKSKNDPVWYGTSGKGYTKNQPKKVTEALYRDYPSATNIVWSKYKGDYTATFNNGIWRSTAVYHANGERRDTRTVLTRQQLPGTIWDKIFKRDNITPTGYVKIERPSVAESIFRILTGTAAYYYDENGNRVQYDY